MVATEATGLVELVSTEDGSRTYLHPSHGASYRSLRGAATESRHVFLAGSRLLDRPSPWRVLELGFGTGLNFQLTHEAAREAGAELVYVAMEPEPMPSENWLVDPCWQGLEWGVPLLRETVTLQVHRSRWQDLNSDPGAFQALYHDPFGPSVAPECWSAECFRWGAHALSQDGILATYGASSAARHAMKAAGLYVGSLPGAPGKREMTVAALQTTAIEHAKPWKRL